MSWNERVGRILLLGAILALAWIGQGLLRSDPPHIFDGLIILTLGAIAFASLVSWSNERSASESRWITRLRAVAERSPQSVALIGAGVLCWAASLWFASDPRMIPWPALAAWAGGIALLLAGAWRLRPEGIPIAEPHVIETNDADASAPPADVDAPAPDDPPSAPPDRSDALAPDGPPIAPPDEAAPPRYARWELLALLVITLIALAARTALLTSIPHNFGGDEGEMGMVARDVLNGVVRDPFATGWLSHPTLWFFMQSLALQAFGNNVFGLRLLSALIGTATVPMLYVFARPLFGRANALMAAALLAAYHMHIHFSRIALNNIVDPLLLLAAFAAFFHGYRTQRPFSFALAGVAMGLSQHFYMGARLTPLLMLFVLAHQILLDRRRIFALRWQLALMLLGFVLGFGPLLRHFILNPNEFNARLSIVGIVQSGWVKDRLAEGLSLPQILLAQARGAFGGFIYEKDHSAFYDPQMPLLDRASSILFVLGLALALRRWRRPESALLAAWVVGMAVFGAMLLIDPPQSARYVIASPAMCLLIALAISQILALLRWALPLTPRVAAAAGAAAVVLLAVWNLNFYFREYSPRYSYGWLNTEVATDIGLYLEQQPDNVFVYFFGIPRMFYTNGAIRFIAWGVPGYDVAEPITSPDMLPPPPSGYRPVFIFLPERLGELHVVQGRYPDGALEQTDAVSEKSTLFLSYAPR